MRGVYTIFLGYECGTPPHMDNTHWFYNRDFYPIEDNAIYICSPGYQPENRYVFSPIPV